MSAWPQAVWIVKKLQNNFDFSEQINYYTKNLNDLNTRVNRLNESVSGLSDELEQAKEQVDLMASVIRSSKNNDGEPATSEEFTKGTLWLVIN